MSTRTRLNAQGAPLPTSTRLNGRRGPIRATALAHRTTTKRVKKALRRGRPWAVKTHATFRAMLGSDS